MICVVIEHWFDLLATWQRNAHKNCNSKHAAVISSPTPAHSQLAPCRASDSWHDSQLAPRAMPPRHRGA